MASSLVKSCALNGLNAPKKLGSSAMYLTMNRFKVVKDQAEDFEVFWKNRDSYLKSVPGFQAFHLMRGPETEEYVL